MDLKTRKTSRGGVISIHVGKIVTTNYWHDMWYEITDITLMNYLKELIKEIKKNGEESTAAKDGFKTLDSVNPDRFGHPYRRSRGSSTTTTAEFTTESSAEMHDNVYPTDNQQTEEPIETRKKSVAENLIKFFSEFNFDLGMRFVNTLARKSSNYKSATEYVTNYMTLSDKPEVSDITEKMKSDEFKQILDKLSTIPVDHQINKRLEIMYGPAGTGKTTSAIDQYPDANVMVCNNCMLPSDLMEEFDFNDENGNPMFKKSSLRLAMEEGKPIILDEINLLTLDCLRTLQGYLDNKSKVTYKGETFEIKDGFKIIGTMNLIVNGQVFGLPEPLVDRCENIKEVKLNADLLMNAL